MGDAAFNGGFHLGRGFALFLVLAVKRLAGGIGAAIGALLMARLMLVRRLIDLIDDAEIVLGVLKIVFSGNAITGRRGVTRQCQVFFMDLEGVATDANVRAVAVKGLVPQRNILPAAADVDGSTSAAATTTTAATSAPATRAVVTPAARTPVVVLSLSHAASAEPVFTRNALS